VKRVLILALPVLFLLMHVLQVPVVLPSFLLPRRALFAGRVQGDPVSAFRALQQHRSLLVPSGDSLQTLSWEDSLTLEDFKAILPGIPQSADLGLPEILRRAMSFLPPLCRVVCLLDRLPSAAEIAALRRLQGEGLPPVQFELARQGDDPLLLACSYSYGTQESSTTLDLLFAPRVRRYSVVRAELQGRSLWTSSPAGLLQGRELHLSFPNPPEGTAVIQLSLEGDGEPLRRALQIQLPGRQDPPVLLVTEKAPHRSFLESLYGVRRVSPAQAAQENLAAYPLVVLDGVPLDSFGPRLTAAIAEIHRRKSASLFFVSDSPRFGRQGDNPPIEEILPVQLSPRSLRYLPDLGILILLDVSASMMGDKLSLAKVSTLQLLKNLKQTDRISILTFWDNYSFLHGFEENHSLRSEVQLTPLIAQGGTDLYKALAEGLNRLVALDMEEKHVILITDGNTKEGDFPALLQRAHSHGITMSALAVGEEVNVALLSRIAQATGGHYYRVKNFEEIPSIIFEDRKEIARSSFARDKFTILDSNATLTGQVSGMSLFTPKPGHPILFRNQLDDPLLMVERRDRQLILMFLSDLYGTYTAQFLANPEVLRVFRATLDPVLRRQQIAVQVAEARQTISLTLSGSSLVEPRIEVYRENQLSCEESMQAGPFQTYHAEFPVSSAGSSTVVLYSQGVPFARIPVYYNGLMEGLPADAAEAAAQYRVQPLVLHRPGGLYLILFFLASVAVTWWGRNPLRSGNAGP
jgi:uncharacterized protein YegL